MILKRAVKKSLIELKSYVNQWMVLGHVLKNEYFVFDDDVEKPQEIILDTLNDLCSKKHNLINRVGTSNGGYLFGYDLESKKSINKKTTLEDIIFKCLAEINEPVESRILADYIIEKGCYNISRLDTFYNNISSRLGGIIIKKDTKLGRIKKGKKYLYYLISNGIPKVEKQKKTTTDDAIIKGLADFKKPIGSKELAYYIIKNNYYKTTNKSFPISVSAALGKLVKKDNPKVAYIKVGKKHLYYLIENGVPEVKPENQVKEETKPKVSKSKKPTTEDAILKGLADFKKPIGSKLLGQHILQEGYYNTKNEKSFFINISGILGKLAKKENSKIDRIKKGERDYLYSLKSIGNLESTEDTLEDNIVETIKNVVKDFENISLEDKFEEITGLNFPTFYKKYRPKLVWYLTRYTRDQELAEDFADDAFTQSLIKIDNYNNEKSQIHTWIYKIAENLVKKDFKDKKKMSVVSLDKDNSENLNLINIIPNGQFEETNIMEQDSILLKKAEIVKDAISNLPEKYKKVMVLRELENRPYIDIAEICIKESEMFIDNEEKELPGAIDFLDLNVDNKSNNNSYVNITFNEGVEKTIQFEIKPYKSLKVSREDLENVSNIEIISNGMLHVQYRTTTNLSTIKSQISKGRQLIQSMVSKKFKLLDDQGVDNIIFNKTDELTIDDISFDESEFDELDY